MKKKVLFLSLTLLSLILFVTSVQSLNNEIYQTKVINEKITNERSLLDSYNEKNISIAALQQQFNNNEIVGYLSSASIDMKTIITQTKNNTYYLNHGLDRKYSRAGANFFDHRNDLFKDRDIVIYGHSSPKHDLEFNKLLRYIDRELIKKDSILTLRLAGVEREYEIVSVIKTRNAREHLDFSFEGNKMRGRHLIDLKKASIYPIAADIDEEDNLLLIQTCMQGEDRGYKLIVVAKQKREVLENEKEI